MLGTITGQWKLAFQGLSIKLGMSGGKLTIGGTPVQFLPSNNPQYSTTDGWLKFNYQGGWTFYIKFSAGKLVNIVAMKNGVPMSGTVTQTVTQTAAEITTIPSTCKYLVFCLLKRSL